MKRFNYTIHNVVAHPLMEILHLVGFTELGNRIHDATLPKSQKHQENQDQENQDQENQDQEDQDQDVAPRENQEDE